METRDIELRARDGYPLAGTLYEPATDATRTVIINSATAVKRRFYDDFARLLCAHGLRVVSYDYRGIGDSLHGPIRSTAGIMSDWGRQDLAGVLDEVSGRFPDSRVLLVGHSAGGQLLGLADNNCCVRAMLAVGAQSGYWRFWPRPQRYLLASLWYAVMPGLTQALSYFPAKRLGLGEDLPAGVALEWARWCRRPQYLADRQAGPWPLHFETFDGAILAYSIDDDWMAPRLAVEALLGLYGRARIERRHVTPTDIHLGGIGHFGFFKESCRSTLWRESVEWLRCH